MLMLLLTVRCSYIVPTVPIIHNVSAVALRLFPLQVDITLLTDGGQRVTVYTVSVYMCLVLVIIHFVLCMTCVVLRLRFFTIDVAIYLMQIEIRGVNYTGVVESSVQNQVSVQVSQLEQNFTKGESHTVMVFATNSVGTSNPQSTQLIVPCELANTMVQQVIKCSCI